MNLSSVRIITADIQRLVPFYEKVTGMTWTWYTPDFAELRTSQATLAIGSTNTLAPFGGSGVAVAANNQSVIIEFRVHDVDKTYEALADFLIDALIQPPTTMPWGNRSLLFRDPDGNLVNFFAPVTAEARQRLN
ncbi:catechol 2,3-dioxygenase-like lactoylglutathione lyase family enzyme [Chitinophaga polysaccharea]|uniref:Catechol 2,3-dioxygenase-like lactoylglutathione lyase family enzyme n=1 Tax=Chitinophaga polysaccharea TaxID=1293035 RepID=A0A561P9Y4_9BACT|nr:VOC family protein [Chitinophaga polysaccharea]TWF34934.1 catechol 2,3-dioxygenase-like lactoylglutathione lyase family enzyme [Chitinophaga polysaccharea]